MFHKVVLCILILSCFSLSSWSGENDERIEEREEQLKEGPEQDLAKVKQKEALLKEEAKKADAEGTAVLSGICDRSMPVQKALLAKADKENCAQITNQDLQAVVEWDLSGQNIIQLKANDFSGLTSLQVLYLHNNKLVNLPEGVFSDLTSLEWLDLENNQLASLPVGVFSSLTSLERLYLSWNQLTSLPEGVFSSLTSLEWLYLFGNQLTSLPEGVFSGLTSLQMLYLHKNQLVSLPEGLFSSLTSLEWLSLNNNELESLPVGIFSSLASLEKLFLDASFQQEKDRIVNEVGRNIKIIFEDSSDNPWYKFLQPF